MLKVDAITFFGSKTKLANAAGVRLASVAAWGILVPEGRAMRLQRDPFWVKNIMSPSKLREKWDELVIRLGRSPVQRCVNHISEPDTEIPPGFRG